MFLNTISKTKAILQTFNIRSIFEINRQMTFSNAIATNNYDTMCNSETWLVQEVPDEALFFPMTTSLTLRKGLIEWVFD